MRKEGKKVRKEGRKAGRTEDRQEGRREERKEGREVAGLVRVGAHFHQNSHDVHVA
jgi:hypothetical protein